MLTVALVDELVVVIVPAGRASAPPRTPSRLGKEG